MFQEFGEERLMIDVLIEFHRKMADSNSDSTDGEWAQPAAKSILLDQKL